MTFCHDTNKTKSAFSNSCIVNLNREHPAFTHYFCLEVYRAVIPTCVFLETTFICIYILIKCNNGKDMSGGG